MDTEWWARRPWWTDWAFSAGVGLVTICAAALTQTMLVAGLVIGFVLLAVAAAGVAIHFVAPRWAKSKAPTLPLTITEISRPSYARNAGLWTDVDIRRGDKVKTLKLDTPLIGTREIFISNTSLTNSVTLKIDLLLTDETGRETRLSGEGRDRWGKLVGRNDWATLALQKRDMETPHYILSPTTIKPQNTIRGSLLFLITQVEVPDSSGMSEEEEDELLGKTNRQFWYYFLDRTMGFSKVPEFSYVLEITDLISAITIKIPLPSAGYKGLEA